MAQTFFEDLETAMYPSALLHTFGVNGKVSGSVGAIGEMSQDVAAVIHGASGSGEGAGAWMHNASCSSRKCRGRGSGRRASRRWNPEFTGAFELLL